LRECTPLALLGRVLKVFLAATPDVDLMWTAHGCIQGGRPDPFTAFDPWHVRLKKTPR
jgi:hypothetical protein